MSVVRPLLAMGLLAATSLASAAPLSLECVLKGSCLNTQSVMKHLEALQTIALANNGTRAAGTTGHELSANYVAQQLLAVGYKVELQPFEFMKFNAKSSGLIRTSGVPIQYREDTDYHLMSYSGSGEVGVRSVSGVDLALGTGNQATSGCESEDFANFPRGHIALIQRGTCNFQVKVENAQAAGASGVVLFNQGNTPDREALFNGTLSEGTNVHIPVVAISYPLAMDLLSQQELTMSLRAETQIEKKVSFNVIAETKNGNPDNIVMMGAHLDSVPEGPGINDNGSGSAAILDVALRMKNLKPTNKIRFAWFSAEELGLIGSTKYVASLNDQEKQRISLMLNVDMIGSPNYKIAVYDGDGSKFGLKGPQGSAAIEQKFHNFFSTLGIQSVETEMNGRSDYAAFAAAGIAVGGVFTGAEGVKTAEEAAYFGGTAGEAYDACYHKACDGIQNINADALEANTGAIAYLLLSYADSTLEVRSAEKNAVRGPVVYPKHMHCHEDVYDI